MEATGQLAWEYKNGEYFPISLPCPNSEILPGINWGLAEEIFSPAFWKYQAQVFVRGSQRMFAWGIWYAC